MMNKEEVENQQKKKQQVDKVETNPPKPPDINKMNERKRKRWPTVQTTSSQSVSPNMTDSTLLKQNFEDKSKTGFVGLSNQGATCYLNSLVQTLFMTPELRKMLFQWRYNPKYHGKDERKCIPLQLQKLFARLQLSVRKAVGTKDLTHSFGWEGRDSYIQHDVQELMRVLFDALDKYLDPKILPGDPDKKEEKKDEKKDDDSSKCVSKLFTGVLDDYISTIEKVNDKPVYERCHQAEFMDVQLVIRGVSSIEEALDNYVKPEIMNGDNQWKVEELNNRKFDAEKGFKFRELPYILTLQLKRFDYDPQTWSRIKLANKVTYPFILDMSKYVSKERKKYLYELYSVLIHAGNANGGHYYAYIKNFADGKWYEFNDTNVTAITEEQVKAMAGGNDDQRHRAYGVSTNAYMLMYRLVDKKINLQKVSNDLIPEDCRKEVEAENEAFKKAKATWLRMKDMITLRLFYKSNTPPLTVKVHKKQTIKETTKIVYEELQRVEEQYPPFDCIRLREFNLFTKQPGRTFVGREKMTLEKLGFQSYKPLILESKLPGTEWTPVRDQIELYIFRLNTETDNFDNPKRVKVDCDSTLKGMKETIAKEYKLPPSWLHCVLYSQNTLKKLEGENKLIMKNGKGGLNIKEGSIIYIEFVPPGKKAKLFDTLERQQNQYDIYFNLPGSEEYDQKVSIDQRKTVADLKKAISEIIKIPVNKFRMCNKNFKLPYKNDNQTLKQAPDFTDGAQVYIEEGDALTENECMVDMYIYTPSIPSWNKKPKEEEQKAAQEAPAVLESTNQNEKKDTETSTEPASVENYVENGAKEDKKQKPVKQSAGPQFTLVLKNNGERTEVPIGENETTQKSLDDSSVPASTQKMPPAWEALRKRKEEFHHIGKVVVDKTMKLKDFKKHLVKLKNIPIPIEKMRIRCRYGFSLSNVLGLNEKTVVENYPEISDGKHLVIEQTKEPEDLQEGDLVIYFQQWHPASWTFEPKVEQIINKNTVTTSDQLKKILSEKYNIEETKIDLAIPPTNFEYWIQKECREIPLLNWKVQSKKLLGAPFLLRDGSLILWKDNTEPEKIPLAELRKMESSSGSGMREEALRIRTIYDTPEKETKEEETKNEETKDENPLAQSLKEKREQMGLSTD